jgi:hypothetical protein
MHRMSWLGRVVVFAVSSSALLAGPLGDLATANPVLATPTIQVSQLPASAVIGSSIAAQATVSGGDSPTGTVTFTLYNNPNATGTPLFTDTESLSGGTATSAGYTTTATGTDYWVATYNGDSNNDAITSGGSAAPVTVTQATPTLSTAIVDVSTGLAWSGNEITGAAAYDTATLGDLVVGVPPSGNVTYHLFEGATCSGTPLESTAKDLAGGVVPSSPSSGPLAAGTYSYQASYSGDSNYLTVTSCAAFSLRTAPSRFLATPQLSISAPTSGRTGTTLPAAAVSATISGGLSESGTISLSVFGPSTSPPGICTNGGSPAGSVSVQGNGTYSPPSEYTPGQAGNYWWYASYSGDANNTSAGSTCGTAMPETVVAAVAPSVGVERPLLRILDRTVAALLPPLLRASCSDAPCVGTATLTVARPDGQYFEHLLVARPLRLQLDEGALGSIRIHLTPLGRRLLAGLRHGQRLRVTLLVRLEGERTAEPLWLTAS